MSALLCFCLLPQASFATEYGVNNATIDTVPAGDSYTENSTTGVIKNLGGSVGTNNGTINSVLANGSVGTNTREIDAVEASGSVQTNSAKAWIGQLDGYLTANNAQGTVNTVGTMGSVASNLGDVFTNNGTITTNGAGANVYNNAGTIISNAAGGMIGGNSGTITTNNGSLTKNYSGGTINRSALGSAIETNCSGGTITDNQGSLTTNQGTVTTNSGTIETNDKGAQVSTNDGTINTCKGSIEKNEPDGKIGTLSSGVTLKDNFGTISNNEGTVVNNYGTITNGNKAKNTYYGISTSVSMIGAGDGKANFEYKGDYKNYLEGTFVKDDCTVLITPAEGYSITSVTIGDPDNASVTQNGQTWTVSGFKGYAAVSVEVKRVYKIYVAGEQVTSANANSLAGGAASFDMDTNTLEVHGDIKTSNNYGIITHENITIRLNDRPFVDDPPQITGISAPNGANVTIVGGTADELTLTEGQNNITFSSESGTLTISNCTVTAKSNMKLANLILKDEDAALVHDEGNMLAISTPDRHGIDITNGKLTANYLDVAYFTVTGGDVTIENASGISIVSNETNIGLTPTSNNLMKADLGSTAQNAQTIEGTPTQTLLDITSTVRSKTSSLSSIYLHMYSVPNSYTVKFDANCTDKDIVGHKDDVNVKHDANYVIPDSPYMRTAYTFVCWNTKADGTGQGFLPGQTATNLAEPGESVTLYAQWAISPAPVPGHYIIHFDPNGGEGTMASVTATSLHAVELPLCTFTNPGNSFAGWNTKADGTGQGYQQGEAVEDLANPYEAVTLYAQWSIDPAPTPDLYSIHFDANGGQGVMGSVSARSGSAVELPLCAFTNPGNSFVCWNTKADGTGQGFLSGQAVTDIAELGESVTLYAQWAISPAPVPEYYVIQFDANGGTGTMASLTATSHYAVELPLCAFTNPGNSFVGWSVKADGTGRWFSQGETVEDLANPYEAVTLYAQWSIDPAPTPDLYSIHFDANSGQGVMGSVSARSGSAVELPLCAFTNPGNSFAGWNTKADGTGQWYLQGQVVTDLAPIGESATLYAQWSISPAPTPDFYAIHFDANGGQGVMASILADVGSAVELPLCAFANPGYSFAGWNTKADGAGQWYLQGQAVTDLAPIGESATLYAQWSISPAPTPDFYAIHFDANGGQGIMASILADVGSAVELPLCAFTNPGYSFAGWNTKADGTGQGYQQGEAIADLAPIGESVTLYAQWKKDPSPEPGPGPSPEPSPDPNNVTPNTGDSLPIAPICVIALVALAACIALGIRARKK